MMVAQGTFGRKRLCLAVLSETSIATGNLLVERRRLQRLTYLVQRYLQAAELYELVNPDAPYEFDSSVGAPYSSQLSEDLDALTEVGIVSAATGPIDSGGSLVEFQYGLTLEGKRLLQHMQLSTPISEKVRQIVRAFANLELSQLRRRVLDSTPLNPSEHMFIGHPVELGRTA